MDNLPVIIDEITREAHNYLTELLNKTLDRNSKTGLVNVWTALETIRKAKGIDYRLAAIGRFTEEMPGGPKTQSMRNKSGIHFRNLIDKYTSVLHLPEQTKGNDPHGDLYKEISDKHTRQHVRLLAQENTSLKNQLNIIKHNIARNAPPILPTSAGSHTKTIEGPKLSGAELDSIKCFLEGLDKKGYKINEFGAIDDLDGLELAPPGFIDALKNILALFE